MTSTGLGVGRDSVKGSTEAGWQQRNDSEEGQADESNGSGGIASASWEHGSLSFSQ